MHKDLVHQSLLIIASAAYVEPGKLIEAETAIFLAARGSPEQLFSTANLVLSELVELSDYENIKTLLLYLDRIEECKQILSERSNEWSLSKDPNLRSLSRITGKKASKRFKPEMVGPPAPRAANPNPVLLGRIVQLSWGERIGCRFHIFVSNSSDAPFIGRNLAGSVRMRAETRTSLQAEQFQICSTLTDMLAALAVKEYDLVIVDFSFGTGNELKEDHRRSREQLLNHLVSSGKYSYVYTTASGDSSSQEVSGTDPRRYFRLIKSDSDNDAHDAFVRRIISDFDLQDKNLQDIEKDLIYSLMPEDCKKAEYILITSGKSGAKVYEVRTYSSAGASLGTYIIKIFTEQKIQLEADNERVFASSGLRHRIDFKLCPAHDKGAILYSYASSTQDIRSIPLSNIIKEDDRGREWIGGDNRTDYVLKQITAIFNSLYEFHQHQSPQVMSVSALFAGYTSYEKIIKTLDKLLPAQTGEHFQVNDQQYPNPKIVWDLLNEKQIKLFTARIHGDLHAENIMVDRTDKPFFIDYGKSTSCGPLFADFAVLEANIKYELIGRHFPSSELERLEQFTDPILNYDLDGAFNSKYKELDFAVAASRSIRLAAKKLWKSEVEESLWRNEYLLTLFVISLARARYDDVNQLYALMATGHLGKTLVSSFNKFQTVM